MNRANHSIRATAFACGFHWHGPVGDAGAAPAPRPPAAHPLAVQPRRRGRSTPFSCAPSFRSPSSASPNGPREAGVCSTGRARRSGWPRRGLVLALDVVVWAQHVAFHRIPVLWRFHRMHHADLDYDVTTGLRFHPVEIVLSTLIKMAAVVALGAPALAVVAFEIILNAPPCSTIPTPACRRASSASCERRS